ncbi:MAG: hypothetical protein FAF03_10470 [Epsilonproteobacteria bacterium]|nr:hypothetical protein [Campylobacterota bacterium]
MKIFRWIVGILVVIVVMFNISKKLLCTHDKKVKEIALPLATVIIKHIEKNGVHEGLKNIKEISYELKDCKKTSNKIDKGDHITVKGRERCHFQANGKTYYLEVEYSYNEMKIYPTVVYIDIKQCKTTYVYRIEYNRRKGEWTHGNFPRASVYYDWDSWVCNPKLFRLTD